LDPADVLQFSVPVTEKPEPEDYPAEVATTGRIMDYCAEPGAQVDPQIIQTFGRITPWVAWQLGIAAEVAASNQRHNAAVKLATASMIAAHLCHSIPRLYANLLTGGNVLLRQAQYTEALDIYQTLLRLPFGGGVGERAAAHLAIGSIYNLHLQDPRKAIYHYEHAMRYFGSRNDAAELLRFWNSASVLYKAADDVVGMLLFLCQVKHPQAATAIEQTLNGSLDRILALRSRLLRQGNVQMADLVKSIRPRKGA
jgi:tetratricopeptide (TPR) repeat protein